MKKIHLIEQTEGMIIVKDDKSIESKANDQADLEKIRAQDIDASRDLQYVAVLSSN